MFGWSLAECFVERLVVWDFWSLFTDVHTHAMIDLHLFTVLCKLLNT